MRENNVCELSPQFKKTLQQHDSLSSPTFTFIVLLMAKFFTTTLYASQLGWICQNCFGFNLINVLPLPIQHSRRWTNRPGGDTICSRGWFGVAAEPAELALVHQRHQLTHQRDDVTTDQLMTTSYCWIWTNFGNQCYQEINLWWVE